MDLAVERLMPALALGASIRGERVQTEDAALRLCAAVFLCLRTMGSQKARSVGVGVGEKGEITAIRGDGGKAQGGSSVVMEAQREKGHLLFDLFLGTGRDGKEALFSALGIVEAKEIPHLARAWW